MIVGAVNNFREAIVSLAVGGPGEQRHDNHQDEQCHGRHGLQHAGYGAERPVLDGAIDLTGLVHGACNWLDREGVRPLIEQPHKIRSTARGSLRIEQQRLRFRR